MATLTTEERAAAHADYQRELSSLRQQCGASKAQLREAIDAADAWITANLPAYQAALPQSARDLLTSEQMSQLALIVLRRRVLGV